MLLLTLPSFSHQSSTACSHRQGLLVPLVRWAPAARGLPGGRAGRARRAARRPRRGRAAARRGRLCRGIVAGREFQTCVYRREGMCQVVGYKQPGLARCLGTAVAA